MFSNYCNLKYYLQSITLEILISNAPMPKTLISTFLEQRLQMSIIPIFVNNIDELMNYKM